MSPEKIDETWTEGKCSAIEIVDWSKDWNAFESGNRRNYCTQNINLNDPGWKFGET